MLTNGIKQAFNGVLCPIRQIAVVCFDHNGDDAIIRVDIKVVRFQNRQVFFRILREERDSVPPLSLPLHGMSYVQTGASVGMKYNPVYKLQVQHDGLDLVAPQGAPVYAVADGVVSQVVRSRKGLGNIVEIDHGNGYVSRYCLMGEMSVVKGRRVKRDQQIGTVGISPTLPAPHLHFEIRRRGRVCDPVNFFFASLSPEEYSRMIYLSVITEQSMD